MITESHGVQSMLIVLIGNYPPDKQESMERFAKMLNTGFDHVSVKSVIWRPKVIFGTGFKSTAVGIGKWLSYIDKWMIFPFILSWRLFNHSLLRTNIRFHICDHGNAPYLMILPINRTLVTCHDVLAIRSAVGFSGTFIPVSTAGKYYQKWILNYLRRSKCLAAVSQQTLSQLLELNSSNRPVRPNWKVIHNGLNADFTVMQKFEIGYFLKRAGMDPEIPYLLHVGSNHLRKNRKLLIDMMAALGEKWKGIACFAGEKVESDLLHYAESVGLKTRMVSIIQPNHKTLVSLYNGCEAFVFPSFSEGFGWPLIEAQACGVPVIASNIETLLEIGGNGALYADPNDPGEFAKAFLFLGDKVTR
jgi:glycosyltransferase involved in cell wall biosynthesis